MRRKDLPAGQKKLERGHSVNLQWRFLLPQYWPIWLLYLLSFFLRLIPTRALASIGDAIAALMARGNGKRKQLALINLALCFPETSSQEKAYLYHRHTRILCHSYLNYGHLFLGSKRHLLQRFDIRGEQHLIQAQESSQNTILLIPHNLAFEYAGQWMVIHYPIVSVVRTHTSNALLDWMLTRFRSRYGADFLSSSTNMLPLIRSVRHGNCLFYLPDEDQAQSNSVFAPFYGVDKATMPTLGRLALACNARILPVVPLYDPDSRRFEIRFLPPLEDIPQGNPVQVARRINQVMEEIIDVDRAQYMWSSKIFRTRPEGQKKFYGRQDSGQHQS